MPDRSLDPIVIPVRNAGPLTGAGNNTYLVPGADRLTLVDAGIGDADYLGELARHVARHGRPLTQVLVTHGHADHAAGAPAIRQVFNARCAKHRRAEEDGSGADWQHLEDGERIDLGGTWLTALHTPGHAPDHLVFWHEETRVAFTGDLVNPSGSVAIAWSRGGDMAAYLASVARIAALEPKRLWPGHGPAIEDPGPHLRMTIAHRLRREAQVERAVARGLGTVAAIADSIYDGLDPALVPAARENVRAHLEKLRIDGVVCEEHATWTRRSTSST